MTRDGRPCVFPFEFQGQQMTECLTIATADGTDTWCQARAPNVTTANYCLPGPQNACLQWATCDPSTSTAQQSPLADPSASEASGGGLSSGAIAAIVVCTLLAAGVLSIAGYLAFTRFRPTKLTLEYLDEEAKVFEFNTPAGKGRGDSELAAEDFRTPQSARSESVPPNGLTP